jgi:hypothetical protein
MYICVGDSIKTRKCKNCTKVLHILICHRIYFQSLIIPMRPSARNLREPDRVFRCASSCVPPLMPRGCKTTILTPMWSFYEGALHAYIGPLYIRKVMFLSIFVAIREIWGGWLQHTITRLNLMSITDIWAREGYINISSRGSFGEQRAHVVLNRRRTRVQSNAPHPPPQSVFYLRPEADSSPFKILLSVVTGCALQMPDRWLQ